MKRVLAASLLLVSSSLAAQDTAVSNFNVTGHDKTAIVPNDRYKKGYYDSSLHFSPAVRAGDYIFISGVVAGAFRAKAPIGKEAFQKSVRRAFSDIKLTLEAGGASMNQIVKMRTFHVFDSPYITIGKHEQVEAVAEIKNDFIGEPHPAWTAVGTTALYPDMGLVEIEVVVYAPEKKE